VCNRSLSVWSILIPGWQTARPLHLRQILAPKLLSARRTSSRQSPILERCGQNVWMAPLEYVCIIPVKCVHACLPRTIYIYIHAYVAMVHDCRCVHAYVCFWLCTHRYTIYDHWQWWYVCVNACMHLWMYIDTVFMTMGTMIAHLLFMYVCTNVCVYVCIRMYVCIYIYNPPALVKTSVIFFLCILVADCCGLLQLRCINIHYTIYVS
jgi:hypothetical protein